MALLIDRMESCVTSDVQAEALVLTQMAISSHIFNSCVTFCPGWSLKIEGGPVVEGCRANKNFSPDDYTED